MTSKIRVRVPNGVQIFYLDTGVILDNIRFVKYSVEDDAPAFTVVKRDGTFYTQAPVNGKNIHCTLEQAINRYGLPVYLVS